VARVHGRRTQEVPVLVPVPVPVPGLERRQAVVQGLPMQTVVE
jgi:hypothetical protein